MTILVALLLAGLTSPAQDLRLEDVPSTGLGPDLYRSLPLTPAQRADLENAVKARNFERAETLLAHVCTLGGVTY